MNIYNSKISRDLSAQQFHYIEVDFADHVLSLTLNRAAKKNALHPKMMHEIAFAMQHAHDNKEVWMIVIAAKGNVFCAGADLKAFAGFVEPNDSTIPEPDTEILIGELFNKVHKPVIAKVTGDVYAGGFFFLAGSHIVIAQDNIKFGLPEVKRGLYPFQVMASLMKVMPARKVLDWCIRGYNLPVLEAQQYGLVTKVCAPAEIENEVNKVIGELKGNSPTALRLGLEAYDKINPSEAEHKYLLEMLQKVIMTADGQEGLAAFREKRSPSWTGE